MKYSKHIILFFVLIIFFVIAGCSNANKIEGNEILVQKRIGEKNDYEQHKEISELEKVQTVKDILSNINWGKAVVMSSTGHYQFRFINNKKQQDEQDKTIYFLWVSPKKETVELVKLAAFDDGESRRVEENYFKLNKNDSAKLFEIITGTKLSDLSVKGSTEKEIKLSNNAKMAKNHLEQNGYEVISYQGDSWHDFNKTDLLTSPGIQFWAVQYIEPDEYLNKRIETVRFIIKNHPLDEMFNMGKSSVIVWIIENEVIGGWSYPISKNDDVVGAPFSLDGQTAEEVKGNYSTWLEEWKNKYGE